MEREPLRLAFLFIAEAYQVYHSAAVMFELMTRSDITVDVFYIDPATPAALERLRKTHNAASFEMTRLPSGLAGAAIQSVRILGLAKPQVLRKNEAKLRKYDAIISTEDGITVLFRDLPEANRPARILITHGADARAVPDRQKRRDCDLILAKGPRDVALHLEKGHSEPGKIVAAGYPKFTSLLALGRDDQPLFANSNPTVLYNSHKEPRQRSWDRFFKPMVHLFAEHTDRNLVVAPHIKLFRRRPPGYRARIEARTADNIKIDLGSDRLLDGTYLEQADIYVGDVSSQVYEFLANPRPCIFLNAHKVQWQQDPAYAMWHLGEVIDDPQDLLPAIRRAPKLHSEFVSRQKEAAERSLGDTSPNSVVHGADLIETFVRNWPKG